MVHTVPTVQSIRFACGEVCKVIQRTASAYEVMSDKGRFFLWCYEVNAVEAKEAFELGSTSARQVPVRGTLTLADVEVVDRAADGTPCVKIPCYAIPNTREEYRCGMAFGDDPEFAINGWTRSVMNGRR